MVWLNQNKTRNASLCRRSATDGWATTNSAPLEHTIQIALLKSGWGSYAPSCRGPAVFCDFPQSDSRPDSIKHMSLNSSRTATANRDIESISRADRSREFLLTVLYDYLRIWKKNAFSLNR